MNDVIKNIIPAFLVFLGGIIGVYLTSQLNQNDWKERTAHEEQIKLFEQKLSLIERTTNISSQMPAADDLFHIYFKNSTMIKDKENQIELAEKLAKIRGELRSVMLLNQIYFGDLTRNKINIYLGNAKQNTWWNLPEENYNDIINTMSKEINVSNNYISNDNKIVGNNMSDISKIIWTSLATLFGGIIIYVVGRTIEKFVLEPIQEYKKTLANISYNLIFYANIYSNTSIASHTDKKETSEVLRKLASELSSKTHQIVFYKLFNKLKVIPSYNNSIEASATLIGFSNSIHNSSFEELERRRKKIQTLLNLKE